MKAYSTSPDLESVDAEDIIEFSLDNEQPAQITSHFGGQFNPAARWGNRFADRPTPDDWPTGDQAPS